MIDEIQEFTPTLPDTEVINSQKLEFTQKNFDSWGTLLPITGESNLRVTVLTEECYTVGRSPTCQICLTTDKINSTLLGKISKVHFKILRGKIDNGASIVYVEDLSSNGTFINGTKVGRNQRVILTSSDEISLAVPSLKVFLFIDTRKDSEQWLSEELSTNFLVLRHLGTGGFGDVKLVIDKKTFQKFAMKKLENCKERENAIFNEVNILKRLKHPCIISFQTIYESSEAVFIMLEYMSGGNLLQRIQTRKKLSESECKLIFYQLILGVNYLHAEDIVHRDLKPENVLLEIKEGNKCDILVKITDFGLSKILHSATNLKTACGTLRYTAPEIIQVCSGNYSSKVDIWSLGVILFYCLSGELPFISCITANDLVLAILKGAYIMDPRKWQTVTSSAKSLVNHMLKVNPADRISTADVIVHKWFKDYLMKRRISELVDANYLTVIDAVSNENKFSELVDAKRSKLNNYYSE